MNRNALVCTVLSAVTLSIGAVPAAAQSPAIAVELDATDIARRLVHATITIPDELIPDGEDLDLRYVEWTPGNHNPSGPIQNVVDFVVSTKDGTRLDWRRSDESVYAHIVPDAPAGDLVVTFTYIANQPAVNSRSSDTYGHAEFGGINWNTVLVYPAQADRATLMYAPAVKHPSDWQIASGLEFHNRLQGLPGFRLYKPVTLAELVDSPLIMGRHLKTYTMDAMAGSPHYLHAAAASASQVELPGARLEKFNEMHRQAEHIFGPFPYSRFHYLILLDDALPGFGLEHCTSTYISMRGDRFEKAETDDGDPMSVVPHEYIHAWCGKLLAPEGLLAENYHTTGKTELLWVYEGLVSYYDEVLCVRSGLMTEEEFIDSLTGTMANYELQAGRRWRSVEDTALAMRFLRAPSDSWEDLRRRQDYYSEGALFWASADAIIRGGTNGEKSLDDFCVAFFAPERPGDMTPGVPQRTYTRADVVSGLSAVYPGQDWDGLIRRMIERPQEDPAFELPRHLGYTLEWSPEPTEKQAKAEKSDKGANLRSSLGMRVDASGVITSIVPGSPADRAKLAYGQKIMAIGVHTPEPLTGNTSAPLATLYSGKALREAVQETTETGAVTLILAEGDTLRAVAIPYDGGLRYPRLTRDESRADLLAEVMKPR